MDDGVRGELAAAPTAAPFAHLCTPAVAQPPPAVAALAADVAASLRAHCVHVKLPAAHDAAQPLPSELTTSLARLLTVLGMPSAALAACVRPGCLLLTLDALLPADVAVVDADALLAALVADNGAAGAFIRAQEAVTVRIGDEEASAQPPGAVRTREGVAAAPRPPPLALMALLSTADAVISCAPGADSLAGPLACRLGAAVLPCELRPEGSLLLAASGLEGTLHVEALPGGTALHRAGASRRVLLTTDAAVAAEVAAALPGALGSVDAAESAVTLLGAALGAELPSLAVASAASMLAAALGLPATLRAASAALRVRCATDRVPFERHFLRLLLACAQTRQPAARAALLAAHTECAEGAALAAALLRDAANEGYALPCAIPIVLDTLQQRRISSDDASVSPAQQVLRSATAVVHEISAGCSDCDLAFNSEDEAEGAAADAAMDALGIAAAPIVQMASGGGDAGYVAYLCDVNSAAWRTVTLLALFVHTVHMFLYFVFMRPEDSPAALLARGAVLRKQVHSLRFYDPADLSAPPLTALVRACVNAILCTLLTFCSPQQEYPWPFVLASAPPYVAWTLLVHIPTHLAILYLVTSRRLRPFVRRNYEPLFIALSILELTTYIFMDVLILRTIGRVPRYAFADCMMHTLGVLLFHRTGPFRLALSNFSVLYRAAVTFGIAVHTRAWGMLLWPENAVQFCGLAALLVLAPGNARRMRRNYADYVAANAAKAVAEAAEPSAAGKRKTA